jgi:hypothetical protein
MLDFDIQAALDALPDRSPGFTAEVQRLGAALQAALGVSLKHDSDMNYANGQKLAVGVLEDGTAVEMQRSHFEVDIYISSKGRFYAMLFLQRVRGNEWKTLDPEVALGAPALLRTIRGTLAHAGYKELAGAQLWDTVPGHLTEMDGVPATLFAVLFSEIA